MMHTRKGNRNASPMLFFWICLLSAVFTLLVCPTLDPLNRLYISKFNTLRDICSGRRVYMYDLPPEFNIELHGQSRCNQSLIPWMDLCPRFKNGGYGLKLWKEAELPQSVDEFDNSNWYDTDSYMLEVIFHKRMKSYQCLTNDPSVADAFFVPYYTGLLALDSLYPRLNSNGSATNHQFEQRKSFGMELITWLQQNGGEWWQRYSGRDHFLILGRTAWDFIFQDSWGTGFSALPYVKNMTSLLIERNVKHENEQAIPYPTSFHPDSPERLKDWVAGVKSAQRKFLFSYVGAPRPDIWTVRDIIGSSCIKAGESVCNLVNCSVVKCSHDPLSIYKAFLQANFCLQPRGDSSTRRSTFDCLISGTIPVFFHNDSAYSQYSWHLPHDIESYSVFISEENITKGVSIQETLMAYSPQRISEMRKKIVSIIPNLLYNDYANDPWSSSNDAFEVSVASVLDRIASEKNAVIQGPLNSSGRVRTVRRSLGVPLESIPISSGNFDSN